MSYAYICICEHCGKIFPGHIQGLPFCSDECVAAVKGRGAKLCKCGRPVISRRAKRCKKCAGLHARKTFNRSFTRDMK